MTQLMKVTGLSSGIGGIAWTLGCFAHNSLPQGCIADACESVQAAPLRGTSPVAVALFAVAGVMLAVGGVGLLVLARGLGGLGRTGLVAVLMGALGCVLLLSAGVVSGLVNSDWNGMPGLVVPGVIFLAVGAAILGWVLFRTKVLPTWLAVLLLCTALLLPFANEQTSRILLAVPFGLAWFVAGVTLALPGAPAALQASRPAA